MAPAETPPPAIGPMETLPVFLRLAGRRAVVAGGGAGAAWKAELLAAAGAEVAVFAPDPSAAMVAMSDRVALHRREWTAADLAGAMLVLGESDDGLLAHARAAGALVAVIDCLEGSDLQFGAIVNRSPVLVAISTGGAAPVLAQAVRRQIEAALPRALGAWAEAARAFRASAKRLLPDARDRRRFWERVADAANGPPPTAGALDRLAAVDAPPPGEVVIVGAGPGDPDLLTMKAVRALGAADVIVHDRLVGAGVLELGRREARRISVGKAGYGDSVPQDATNALLIQLAHEGRRVVRLKGGDPAIFARTGEEVAALRDAGVAVSIVPGITAASAAAASLGVGLTHRDAARRVQFVTGHEEAGALPELDLAALADPRATTAVYMGGRTAARLARALIARGLAPETPAAIVRAVSLPDEERVATTLGGLAAGGVAASSKPTLVIIGWALALDAAQAEAAPAARAA